ncbi:MAG: TetR family transcriptional regulator C-terminal domain-containing protein [Pseudomonadales bacterium]
MAKIRDRKKKIILAAACEVFAKQGYAGTKIADIAQKAELPKPNIYYYFENKEMLYRHVLDSFIQPLLLASLPFDRYDDPAVALSDYIKIKIEISKNHPFASKVFANEILRGAPHLPQDIIEQLTAQTSAAKARLNYWIEQGKMDAIDPLHLLFTLWATTQTYADFDWQIKLHHNSEELSDDVYERATESLINLVLKGCGIKANSAE